MDKALFEQYILGNFESDPLFETYVGAWMAYHTAADKIDGHIAFPRNKEERELVAMAELVGHRDLTTFMANAEREIPGIDRPELLKVWISAKKVALQRLSY